MIVFIERKDINIKKYDNCIEKALNNTVYGFSWYLDVVADYWGALVLDNYSAVMPIPYNFKFGLKYALQPFFSQKTGIFSTKRVEETIVNLFLKNIPRSILYVNIDVENTFSSLSLTKKKNYTLELNKEYTQINKNYRRDRKRSLKKSLKAQLTYKDFNNKKELIKLYKKVFEHLEIKEKYFIKIDLLIDYCLKNNLGFIRNVFCEENLVCAGFFLKYNSKVYYLFGASSIEGKKNGATTFLLDTVIKEYCNTDTVFDFEGSTIPNVASFYRSFGSIETTYFNYKTNAVKRVFF